ncbi:MAG: calcium-binding protein [Pseudomonadota bacterium]
MSAPRLIGIDTVDLSSISLGAEIADLAGLSGDTDTLELSDLQLSADWVVQSSDEGWVEFVHPTGSVTFEGVVHDTDTDFFYDLAGVFTLDGTIIPTGPFMIDGGNGDIIGGPLNDSIAGSDDMQIIMGWGGDDTLQGRGGDDAIYGSVGDDWIDGGASNDYLLGGPGDDYVLGGEGRDQIEGSIGNDTLDGGAGDDLLWDHDAVIDEPYESNDLLIGGEGDDRLLAENGSDTLIGGSGFDQMTGGTGADVFRIFAGRPDEGGDVILDFERGLDTLDFSTADMLAADPGLAALAGDPAKLELMDLDASVHWGIGPVANPDQPAEQIVAIAHPTGWVTLTTILHGEDSDSFADLVDVITFDGAPPPDAESPNGDCSDPQPIEIPDGDWIGGSGFDDCLRGSNQNDLLYALAGDDVVHGFVGDDTLFGGEGDDTLIGGSGIDILEGGAGADVFRMAVGQDGDIVDSIMDFERGVDTLDLSLADLLAVDPNLAARAGDPASIELVDLDASAFFDVGQWTNTTQIGEPVFTTITHPTGLIGLATVAYGDDADSFADLADILTLDGQAFAPPPAPTPDPDTITGNPWNEWLKGTGEADSLDALAGDDVVRGYGGDDTLVGGTGDDTLRGEAGDDQLTGGEGADVFRVRSGKWGQGDDTVTDFELGTDKLVFVAADMLKDDPNLAGADGVLGLDDLEASDDFALGASADGDLLISHQTGSVEIDDLAFDATTDSFTEISPILEIEVA